mgnify:CR=1 FL=1
MSCGLDPQKSTLLIQSQIPELCELTFYYMDLVTVARLQRNPTVKSGKIDTVAKRLAHLCLAVRSGQPFGCLVLRQKGCGLHKNRLIHCIKLMDDLPCLFNHRQLIVPHRRIPESIKRYLL